MNSQTISRRIAISEIEASIPENLWRKNREFVSQLHDKVQQHAISTHPCIKALNEGRFSKAEMQKVHLDYRHAIVQIFTDALLMSQYQCRQLEPMLSPGGKMFPRFLLTLNILDEFGFQTDGKGEHLGTPHNAHYPLFEKVLFELGISEEDRNTYVPSNASGRLRDFLELSYSRLDAVVALLGVAEEVVVLFSAPLRRNVSSLGIDVSSGYYWCHGGSDDIDSQANDDTHASDLRYILMQALVPENYVYIEGLSLQYCDLWMNFWDCQMEKLTQKGREKEERVLIRT